MEFILLKSLYPSVKKAMVSETQEASKIPGDFWTFTLENVHSPGTPRTPPVLLEAELGVSTHQRPAANRSRPLMCFYPFTAPAATPLMMYFWQVR